MPEDGTVARQLHNLSEEDPGRPAFIFRGAQSANNKHVLVLTRDDVFQLASSFASMVRDAGVKQGEVVCNTLPSSPERLITDLGLMLAGAVAMNGPVFLMDGTDLLSCLIGSDCVALVADSKQPDNALTVLSKHVCVRGDNAQCTEVPSLKKVFDVDCGGGKDWRPWLEQVKMSDEFFLAKVTAQDMAYVFTTSGTWGFHKLVARTHEQFIAIGQIFHDVMELAPGDVLFNECSMGSLWGSFCTYVATGITRVLVDMTLPSEDPLAFAWHSCYAERCSVAVMLPPQIYSTISKPALWKDKKHRLRNIVTGGMPLSKQQVSAVGRLCEALIIVYASTEGGYISRKRITQDNLAQFDQGDIGDPVGNYVFKLVTDQEEEIRPSQIGVTGELALKGPQMFNGYMGANYLVETDIFTTDGWLKTKDIACYNPCGNVHIICRKYNEIIHGAKIINPFWLEKKLETCPGVNNAMVVPVPDAKVYQEMCMCIVPTLGDDLPTEPEVKAHCLSLAVPGNNDCVPRYMLFFDQFPMTKNGDKPDRKQIFASAMEKLFLAESFSTSQVLF